MSGKTPPGWRTVRLKDLVHLTSGWTFESERFSSTEGVPLIRIRDLLAGRTVTFYDGPVSENLLVRDGDLLIGMDGDFNSVVWHGGTAALNQRVCRLRAHGGLDQRFLRYVIDLPLRYINDLTYSTTVKHLSSVDLMNERILVPCVQQQRAIAGFLDAETARIDALITKKRRMIDLLDERSKAEIDEALGLQATWTDTGIPVPGGTDAPIIRLGFVATVQTGLTLDGARDVEADVSALPYLRVANVQDGTIDLTELRDVRVPPHMARRTMLRAGDVLMTEGGDPDKLGRGAVWDAAVAPCLHQNHVFAVRPDRQLRPDYLALVTRSTYARAYFEVTASKTTGIASTSTAKISAFRLPVPDVEVQADIVDRWHKENDRLAVTIHRLTEQMALLQEHRQALITAAVTGELEVPGVAA